MQTILYMTEYCPLCEHAQQHIIQALGEPAQEIDIMDDATLLERYQVRIPVLQRPDGAELNWPFEPTAVREFIRQDTR